MACVGAAEPGVLRSAVVAFIGEWWASPEWRLVGRRRSRMRRVLDRMVVEGSTVARESLMAGVAARRELEDRARRGTVEHGYRRRIRVG